MVVRFLPVDARRLARSLKQHLVHRLPDALIALRMHRRAHGVLPRIVAPQTFNEKVLHRKLFDRREVLTRFTDKYAVRAYVEGRLGKDVLPQLHAMVEDPARLPFDQLPDKFVVKPTHGSGWIRVVRDKTKLDRADLIETCRSWLRQSYYKRTREWAYKSIRPRIIVEDLIDDGTGDLPIDYKLFVFDGRVQMVQVDVGRFSDHRRDLYTPDWNRLEVTYNRLNVDGGVPRPRHLAEMIRAAESLGAGIDFVRADFYDTPRRIYFGELTTTPEAGLGRFQPREFDVQLGALWNLAPSVSIAPPSRSTAAP